MGSSRWFAAAGLVAVALAAPAVADGARRLVTGKDIKDGTITVRDLAKSARPQPGKPGPAGPVGPVGPAGPSGPPGSAAAIRIERVEGAAVTVPAGSSFPTASVACPPGTRVTGGGFIAEPANNFAVSRSFGTPNQEWVVTGINEGAFAGQVRAIVYCLG